MTLRVRLWCACALTAVAFGSMGIHAQKGPALADLRRAAPVVCRPTTITDDHHDDHHGQPDHAF